MMEHPSPRALDEIRTLLGAIHTVLDAERGRTKDEGIRQELFETDNKLWDVEYALSDIINKTCKPSEVTKTIRLRAPILCEYMGGAITDDALPNFNVVSCFIQDWYTIHKAR